MCVRVCGGGVSGTGTNTGDGGTDGEEGKRLFRCNAFKDYGPGTGTVRKRSRIRRLASKADSTSTMRPSSCCTTDLISYSEPRITGGRWPRML